MCLILSFASCKQNKNSVTVYVICKILFVQLKPDVELNIS